jgi:hypothetical protein
VEASSSVRRRDGAGGRAAAEGRRGMVGSWWISSRGSTASGVEAFVVSVEEGGWALERGQRLIGIEVCLSAVWMGVPGSERIGSAVSSVVIILV